MDSVREMNLSPPDDAIIKYMSEASPVSKVMEKIPECPDEY
jgi:hypothetical protein